MSKADSPPNAAPPSPPPRSARAAWGALGLGLAVFVVLVTYSISRDFAFLPLPGSPEAAFKAELDRRVPEALAHYGVPGAVVGTVVDGEPSHVYAYGLADRAAGRPMTADTVFRAASISKTATAWGVLRLAQDGRLDLDAPVVRYLPAWPLAPSRFRADGVTARRLLSHTAGLDAGPDTFIRPGRPPTPPLDLLAREGDGPAGRPGGAALVAEPGRSFLYSAAGYTLLQALIEARSGQAFPDYMRQAVLTPLNMSSSSFVWDERLRPAMATPYGADGHALPLQMADDLAADSLLTTGRDLINLVAAPLPGPVQPFGGGVLDAAMVGMFYDGPVDIPSLAEPGGGAMRPALGVFIERAPGPDPIVLNGGLDPGWTSQFSLSRASRTGLVVLTNSDQGAPVIAQVTAIWSAWRGLPPSQVTVAFRVLGVVGSLVAGLLAALDAVLAADWIAALSAGRHRLGRPSRQAFERNLLNLAVAISVPAIWLNVYGAIRQMPTVNTVIGVTIVLLALIVAARLFTGPAAGNGPEKAP